MNHLFIKILLILSCCSWTGMVSAQQKPHALKKSLLSDSDFAYLEGLTGAVLEKARLYPDASGNNRTQGVLVRPGGAYPSFWIRDYAMTLESGLTGNKEEEHMLRLAASTQCDQTWITGGGGLVPAGAIADHIRPDNSLPIFFPGTYSYEDQGGPDYGRTPPYDDQFYFIHMGYWFVRRHAGRYILQEKIRGIRLIDRMEMAFRVPPARENGIVYTNDNFRGVDFGFRDAEIITGDLCFTSILKYCACRELASLFDLMGNRGKSAAYRLMAEKIKEAIPGLFADKSGLLRASTGKSQQPDVWGTALAVYEGLLSGKEKTAACKSLVAAYGNKTMAFHGNIRHVLTPDDFSDSSAWAFSLASKNTYQNGAYWGTPVGWVCFAMAQVDPPAASRLAAEYVDDLRKTDFRKGPSFGGPYECFFPPDYKQNPVYLTSVSCPYAVFRRMRK